MTHVGPKGLLGHTTTEQRCFFVFSDLLLWTSPPPAYRFCRAVQLDEGCVEISLLLSEEAATVTTGSSGSSGSGTSGSGPAALAPSGANHNHTHTHTHNHNNHSHKPVRHGFTVTSDCAVNAKGKKKSKVIQMLCQSQSEAASWVADVRQCLQSLMDSRGGRQRALTTGSSV